MVVFQGGNIRGTGMWERGEHSCGTRGEQGCGTSGEQGCGTRGEYGFGARGNMVVVQKGTRCKGEMDFCTFLSPTCNSGDLDSVFKISSWKLEELSSFPAA